MPLLRLNNPLAYPAGVHAGVSWQNPALGSGALLRFSGVASASSGTTVASTAQNCGFVALYPRFQIGQTTNGTAVTITNSVDPIIGPSISASAISGSQSASFTGQTVVADASVVTAAIFRTSTVATQQFITSTGGNAICIQLSAAGLIEVGIPFGTLISTGVTATANTPYFVVMSIKTGAQAFWVVNLATGKATSGTAASAITMPTPSGSVQILTAASNAVGFGGKVATFMFSNGWASVPELSPWAHAPFDFWYPPTAQNLILTSLQAPQSAPSSVSIAWQIPFEHRLIPPTTIDGGAFVYSPPTTFLAPQPQFEHRLTPPVLIDGPRQTTNIAAIPATISGQAWLKAFEHRLSPQTIVDGRDALTTNISAIPAIVSGMAWYQAFEHRLAKPVPAIWDGVWRLSAAIPIPVWWYSAFQHNSTPSVRVDGAAVPWQPVAAVSTIAGMAWQKSFEHRATAPIRVDGAVTPWQPVAVVSTISGMAWQKSFEHQVGVPIRVDGTITPWQPVTVVSTISGMAWFAPFESRLTAPIQPDTSSAYYLLPTAAPPSSYFFNRFRAAIGARSGTHQQDK
jgi:hypothetical protein